MLFVDGLQPLPHAQKLIPNLMHEEESSDSHAK
jgi:hypothetical protein